METIGRYGKVELFGLFTISEMDWQALYGTWAAMAFLLVMAWLATRNLQRSPGRLQYLFEVMVGAFDNLCQDSVGEKGRRYTAMIGSTFLLLLICNWLGTIPGFIEPTKNINTCLGVAIVGFLVTLYSAIESKGLGGYIGDYFEPMAFMAPLNLIGECAKVISIACRLFGNIMGGAIIITVVSYLTAYFLTPMGLMAYFGVAVGLIQAFVFTMLTLTYLAVAL